MAEGYIKDNSVLKMIENSLYDGALHRCPTTLISDTSRSPAAFHASTSASTTG